MAADRLKQLGFTQVYDMNGGMMKWRSAGLPVAGGAAVANKGMDRKEYNALLNDNRVVVVDFYAPWCGPCKKMAPYLDELSKSQASKLKIVRINTDEHLSISNELKVDALPTIYLYKNGKKIWEHVGYISKEDLMKQVNKNS